MNRSIFKHAGWVGFAWLLMTTLVWAEDNPPRKLSEQATKILHTRTNAVLYSIDPEIDIDQTNSNRFVYGHKILGKTSLDGNQVQIVVAELEQGIKTNNSMFSSMCFNPRHMLRTTAAGGSCDFLICYECSRVSVICSGEKSYGLGLSGSADRLNKILRDANIPLANKWR
jgi:hypothetical protein